MRDSVLTIKLHSVKNFLLAAFVTCYFSVNYFEGVYRYLWLAVRLAWYAVAVLYIWNQRKVRLWSGFIPSIIILLFSMITLTYNFEHLDNSLVMLGQVLIVAFDLWLILASTQDKKEMQFVWRGLFLGGVIAAVNQLMQIDLSDIEEMGLSVERYTISETLFVNSYAYHLFVSFLAGYYLIIREKDANNRLLIKSMIVIGMIVVVLNIFFTGSRKILIAIPVFLLFATCYGKKIFWRLLLIAALVVGIYYLIMEVPALYNIIGFRIESLLMGEGDESAIERNQLMKDAFETGLFHPWGVGIDNSKYYSTTRQVYAHNNYLELFADFGWIGVICYYVYYVKILHRAVRNKFNYSSSMRNFYLACIVVLILIEVFQVVYYNFAYHLTIAALSLALIDSDGIRTFSQSSCAEP